MFLLEHTHCADSPTMNIFRPLLARSMSRSAGSALADYVFKYLKHRTKRDIGNKYIKVNYADNEVPKLPEEHKHAFHGGNFLLFLFALSLFLYFLGERAILYGKQH